MLMLTLHISAQEEYPDTITLISGESQAVRIDKIRSKGKKINFYLPGDPKLKKVKTSSVESYVIAADIPFHNALEYFDHGRSTWMAEGSEQYKKADSDDLEKRVAKWLNQRTEYPNQFTDSEDFEAGVKRGEGKIRLGVSHFLTYDMTIQSFGNTYTWRISDPRFSEDESLRQYILTNCYKSDGTPKPNVSGYSKQLIVDAEQALKGMVNSLKVILAE